MAKSEETTDTLDFDAVKALRIARSRTKRLRDTCTDADTREGLDDLHEWLSAVITLVQS